MTVTESHFEELSKTFDFLRNSPSYPTVSYFKYVRGLWYKYGYLSEQENQFILDLCSMSKADLYQKAYIMGKWYDIEPKDIKYYNLQHNKLVKKCIHR